jgi:hypothetical protein
MVMGALTVTFVTPSLFQLVPLPRRIDRQATQLAVSLAAICIGMPAMLGVFVVDARRRRRWVGWSLESAGMKGEGYLMRGMQGHGAVGGRPVHAYWVPPARYRSTSLEVSVDSHVAARLVACRHQESEIATSCGMPDVPHGDPSLAPLRLTAEDPRWAHGVLSDGAGSEALRALCHPADGELRWVKIEPGAVHLRTTGLAVESITPEIVGAVVASLSTLASAAERAPAPAYPQQPSKLEAALRQRSTLGPVIAAIVVILVVVLSGAAAVLAFLIGR